MVHGKEIQIEVTLVPSEEDQADFWSRAPVDTGDYTMDKTLFRALLKHLKHIIVPRVDMFASPGNHQKTNSFPVIHIGKPWG